MTGEIKLLLDDATLHLIFKRLLLSNKKIVRKRNVDDDMKQTGNFCDHCVLRNHTIVQFCSDQGNSDDYLM